MHKKPQVRTHFGDIVLEPVPRNVFGGIAAMRACGRAARRHALAEQRLDQLPKNAQLRPHGLR